MSKKQPKKELTSDERLNQKINAYKAAFDTPSGRLVLADLKKKYSASAFSISSTVSVDPYRTHFDLGKLVVFNYIQNQIDRELIEEKENE